jgi:peptidase M48-like protein
MSTAAIAVALAGAAGFGLCAPFATRRLPPRPATWLISVGAVACALSSMVVLALLAFVVIGQLPLLADEGGWSSSALHHHAFTEPGVGVASLGGVVAAGVALALAGRRQGMALVTAYRACKSMPTASRDLVVLREAPAEAVAVPGRPGRIVVAGSLLAVLTAAERRALLAHEHAHLDHGHHWHRTAVSLAAAANPLLAPLRAAIGYTTERWADEQAAAEVGDRRHVATALARVALLTRRPPGPAQLGAAAQAVPARIGAMLAGPPRPRRFLTGGVLSIPVLSAVAAAVVWKDTEHLFELAERIYRSSGAR